MQYEGMRRVPAAMASQVIAKGSGLADKHDIAADRVPDIGSGQA